MFYARRTSESLLMITWYVDTLLIAGSFLEVDKSLKSKLADLFEMEDCRGAKIFLVLQVSINRQTRTLKLSPEALLKRRWNDMELQIAK